MKKQFEIDGVVREFDVPDDATDEEILEFVNSEVPPPAQPEPKKKMGYGEQVATAAREAGAPLYRTIKQTAADFETINQGGAGGTIGRSLGKIGRLGLSVYEGIPETIGAAVGTLTAPLKPFAAPIGRAINRGMEKAGQAAYAQGMGTPLQPEQPAPLIGNTTLGALGAVGKWQQSGTPEQQAIRAATLGYAGVLPIGGPAGTVVKTAAEKAPQIAAKKAIEKGVEKGIKPKVVGKGSIKKLDNFYANTEQAVNTIAENREILNLAPDADKVVNRPRNLKEMAEAINQTKKAIYEKYNQMAVEAGEGGVSISTTPIMERLTKIAGDEAAGVKPDLKYAPEVRKYAEQMKAEIAELEGASPEVVEERIKDLNNSLTGFYEGRTSKAKAQVDASVANALREELDNKITGAVGEGYQELKNKYGSLKAIEQEVNHRALINARKNAKGLADLTDIFTGSDIAAGLLTANPALILKGAVGQSIKNAYKSLNDPDRYINNMFKAAYKSQERVSLADIGKGGPIEPMPQNVIPFRTNTNAVSNANETKTKSTIGSMVADQRGGVSLKKKGGK